MSTKEEFLKELTALCRERGVTIGKRIDYWDDDDQFGPAFSFDGPTDATGRGWCIDVDEWLQGQVEPCGEKKCDE